MFYYHKVLRHGGRIQDTDCAWHILYWSAFHPVDDTDWTELIADGLDGIERAQARWHIVGCRWGRQAGHEETHLWEWTGAEMSLLAPGYRDVVY